MQGPDRIKNLYAFRSLVDNGVRVTFGSDAPVEDINPMASFYAAVTRLSPDGRSPRGPGGWYVVAINSLLVFAPPSISLTSSNTRFPEQRLSRVEALRG